MSLPVILSRYSYTPGLSMISRVLIPAVIASGFPERVPACTRMPQGSGYHLDFIPLCYLCKHETRQIPVDQEEKFDCLMCKVCIMTMPGHKKGEDRENMRGNFDCVDDWELG